MATHGFESLGDALRKFGVVVPSGPLPPDEDPVIGCSRCLDSGWLRRDVPAHHQDFGRLVECPCGVVAQQRVAWVFHHSQVPPRYRGFTLDGYVACGGRPSVVDAVRRAWTGTDRNLLLTGPVGVGKTGVAISLLNERLAAGEGGMYITAPDLFTTIRGTYGADGRPQGGPSGGDAHASEATVLSTLVGASLVVLDDLGMVRLTDWGREKLFTLVNERFGRGARTIVTTNLRVEDGSLEDHVGSPTFDRLVASSEVFVIEGESLR